MLLNRSLLAASLVALSSSAWGAAVPIGSLTVAGTSYGYTQNFDSLATTVTSTTSANWQDDTTLSSWLAGIRPGALNGTAVVPQTLSIAQGTGSSNTGRLYSFGTTATSADRSLGSLPSDGSTGTSGNTNLGYYYGVRFVNNTTDTITSVKLVYTGEEYRASYNAVSGTDPTSDQRNNNVTVGFQVYAAGGPSTQLTDSTYTAFTGATFSSPIDGPATGTTSLTLDGNLPANRVADLTSEMPTVVLPGQEIWIRWYDSNSSGADHALGIDDVALTFAVPEPASLTMLAGLTGLVVRRRR